MCGLVTPNRKAVRIYTFCKESGSRPSSQRLTQFFHHMPRLLSRDLSWSNSRWTSGQDISNLKRWLLQVEDYMEHFEVSASAFLLKTFSSKHNVYFSKTKRRRIKSEKTRASIPSGFQDFPMRKTRNVSGKKSREMRESNIIHKETLFSNAAEIFHKPHGSQSRCERKKNLIFQWHFLHFAYFHVPYKTDPLGRLCIRWL